MLISLQLVNVIINYPANAARIPVLSLKCLPYSAGCMSQIRHVFQFAAL